MDNKFILQSLQFIKELLLMGCGMEAESPVRLCGIALCRTCSEQPEQKLINELNDDSPK
ncbi:MAG TPA: hypothetical protein VIJ92_00070 [Ginsengibacter sp.]